MSSIQRIPDYELDDRIELTTHAQLRAIAHPVRDTILQLLLERAATVAELATAIGRPNSTVAHHVDVLVRSGMLKVVRTRRVRALEERSYGRTARTFLVAAENHPRGDPRAVHANALETAAAESAPAHAADGLRSIHRYARVSRADAAAFWDRVLKLSEEFAQLPREGDAVYGFAAGLYPTDHPTLPPRDDED